MRRTAALKIADNRIEARRRAVRLHLDDVQREFVAPRDFALLGFFGQFAGRLGQQSIGQRRDVERRAVDDHVFDLDAEHGEGGAELAHVGDRPRFFASMRCRNTLMISRYSADFSTASS